jgi:hypothetical protein
MKSLRAIQILQLMIIMTSMKKDKLSCWRNERRTSKGSPMEMKRFKDAQQLRAKLQLRKRCSKVSSAHGLQRTQSYDGMTWFLRRRMFLVLSRSLCSSQKKTLCRFCTDVFHCHLKAWCTYREPIRWRYACLGKKKVLICNSKCHLNQSFLGRLELAQESAPGRRPPLKVATERGCWCPLTLLYQLKWIPIL